MKNFITIRITQPIEYPKVKKWNKVEGRLQCRETMEIRTYCAELPEGMGRWDAQKELMCCTKNGLQLSMRANPAIFNFSS